MGISAAKRLLFLCFGRESEDMKLMRHRLVAMLATDLVAQFLELFGIKLDHFSGFDADEIIVRCSSSNHFEIALAIIEEDLLENAGILQVIERAVDRCPADTLPETAKIAGELFCFEQPFFAQSAIEDHRSFGCELEFLSMEITTEDRADRFVGIGWPGCGISDLGKIGKNLRLCRHAYDRKPLHEQRQGDFPLDNQLFRRLYSSHQ